MESQNWNYLSKRLQENSVPQSLLFAGSSLSAKETTALKFAQALLDTDQTTHPDLYIYTPEGKLGLHTMETLKSLSEEVYLPPYCSSRKVFLILEAERMATTSANALLKTFEEPLHTSYILLCSSFAEKLLPTIRSRCQMLYFRDEQPKKMALPKLLDILRSLPHLSYPELLEQAQQLALEIEKHSQIEPEAIAIELTIHQKQAMEKMHEGKEVLALTSLARDCFSYILGWFRDLHLLHLRGDPKHLFFPEEMALLQQWVEQGLLPALDPIADALKQAERTLERSSPLRHTLESLFINLKESLFKNRPLLGIILAAFSSIAIQG